MTSCKDYYDLYVAEDQLHQARVVLRQALSVLRRDVGAYPLVRQALDSVEAKWRLARATVAAAERGCRPEQEDYVVEPLRGSPQL